MRNASSEGVTGTLVKGTIYDPGTGNIGIGTTSPGNYKLNIQGDASTVGLRVTSSGGSERTILVENSAGATLFEVYSDKASFPNGNVGIGTTTPSDKLDVRDGNIVVGTADRSVNVNYSTGSTDYRGTYNWEHLQLGNNGGNYIVAGNTAEGGLLNFVVNNSADLSGRRAGTYHNGTVAMTILANGNVGIGTASPGSQLDVRGITQITDDGAAPDTSFYASFGVTRANVAQNNAYIGLTKQGIFPWAIGIDSGSSLIFGQASTSPARTIPTPLVTLTTAGNVGIGTTPEAGATLDVNGVIQISSGGYRIGTDVDGDGNRQFLVLRDYEYWEKDMTVIVPAKLGFRVTKHTGTKINLELEDYRGDLWIAGKYKSWGSDSRIKFDQEPLDYGLAQVLALQPKRYMLGDWNKDAETGEIVVQQENATNDIGLAAQDVHDVIPEAVTKPEDETRELWSLCSDKIIPVVVKGMQDLHQIIEEQQEQIDELKQRIDALEGREGGGS